MVDGTPFLKYELDPDPLIVPYIHGDYTTKSLTVLLKPAMERAIKYVINTMFKSLAMEQRHECILIDSQYPEVASQIHDIDGLFENAEKFDFGNIQRISNFLISCYINLGDFDVTIKNSYYFIFMINRNVMPFNLLFLGYYYNDILENSKKKIYIDALIRGVSLCSSIESDLSKRKKQKGEYARKKILLSDPEEKFIF